MDEGVYDARDDEDVAVELRRRKERDDLSDELDARGGKRGIDGGDSTLGATYA